MLNRNGVVNILQFRWCQTTCTYVRDSPVVWWERTPSRTIVSTTVRTCQYCNDSDADVEADADTDSIPLLYINNEFEIQISYESMQNSAGQ